MNKYQYIFGFALLVVILFAGVIYMTNEENEPIKNSNGNEFNCTEQGLIQAVDDLQGAPYFLNSKGNMFEYSIEGLQKAIADLDEGGTVTGVNTEGAIIYFNETANFWE